MFPILIEIGPLKLYSYGLMMAVAFISAIYWSQVRAKRYNISPQFISNLGMVCVVAGIVGGRVAYLMIEESLADVFSFKLFEVWKGGMVFYGGFIAAVLASIWYCRKHHVDFLSVADIMSPPIALAHFFGRLGCLLAGCCFGKQCDLPWAITFRNPVSLAPLNVPLHPTQLYEALGNLIVVAILLLFQRGQKFRGEIFAYYLALYAILRASVETFRGDEARGFVDFGGLYPNEWLSTSTLISAVMISIAIFIFVKFRGSKSPYTRGS